MIEVLKTVHSLQQARQLMQQSSVGLVPTMGNLHQGHLKLIEKSLSENLITFVSIFVNPKQFGENEDFSKYPRTLDNDLALLNQASSPDKKLIVFAPNDTEVFPENYKTEIHVTELTDGLCGKSRPTHFKGVTTVVYRLFNLIRPDTAYFGEKDYQQLCVIKQMAKDLQIPIKIQSIPTVREQSGLALSSRNQYLSIADRENALMLSKTLIQASELLKTKKSIVDVYDLFEQVQKKQVSHCKWEYLEVLNQDQLTVPKETKGKLVILGALSIGKTRLIDNVLVEV